MTTPKFDPWDIEFSKEQVQFLAPYIVLARHEDAHFIFREGDPGDSFFMLAQGQVEIAKKDSVGEQRVMTVLNPGQTFGEMALLERSTRSASARAKGTVTLFMISQPSFTRLVQEHPDLGVRLIMKIASRLSRRLRHVSTELVEHLGDVSSREQKSWAEFFSVDYHGLNKKVEKE